MQFFDKIAASVSKTAREVSDGAKTLADKNRLRKDIAAIENELRSRFRDIGEQFYAATSDCPPAEYADLFQQIADLKETLAGKQRDLDALERIGTCPSCGKPVAKDARFCASCGAGIPETAPAQAPAAKAESVCPQCGNALAADAMFCAVCGTKIEKPVNAEPAAEKKNICPNCGEVLPDGALFCAVCGTKAPDVD
jgi:predicted amidophosphoribosyltransferase